MDRHQRRTIGQHLRKENARQSDKLEIVPVKDWPPIRSNEGIFALFRSKRFLVQLFHEPNDIIRLSVCRTQINGAGEWEDDITWEELQEIKNQCGYGHCDAVEIYPREKDVINVANMRHLWVVANPIAFAWRA